MVQAKQHEYAAETGKLEGRVQQLQHQLAIMQSDKDLVGIRELPHLTKMKDELRVAHKTIQEQVPYPLAM